jgi:hypothetical protein
LISGGEDPAEEYVHFRLHLGERNTGFAAAECVQPHEFVVRLKVLAECINARHDERLHQKR